MTKEEIEVRKKQIHDYLKITCEMIDAGCRTEMVTRVYNCAYRGFWRENGAKDKDIDIKDIHNYMLNIDPDEALKKWRNFGKNGAIELKKYQDWWNETGKYDPECIKRWEDKTNEKMNYNFINLYILDKLKDFIELETENRNAVVNFASYLTGVPIDAINLMIREIK